MRNKTKKVLSIMLVAFFLILAFASEEENNTTTNSSNTEVKKTKEETIGQEKFSTQEGTLDLIQGTWEGHSSYSVNYGNVHNNAHIRITIIGTDIKLDLGWGNNINEHNIHDESVWEESFTGKIVVGSIENITYKGKCRVIKIQSNSGFPLWYRSMGHGEPAELAVYFRHLKDLTKVLSIDAYPLTKIKNVSESKQWNTTPDEEIRDTIEVTDIYEDEYLGSDGSDDIESYGENSFYIINIAAVKSATEAKEKVKGLINSGYQASYLWIPDYNSLSKAEYYSVYVGPFESQQECEHAVQQYRQVDPNAYGLLVSQENKRVKITGIGKVVITEPYH